MLATYTRRHTAAVTGVIHCDEAQRDNDRDGIDEFEQRHGRRPRILHIGNIANNAYHNAKLLNDVGFDCDVICYDYYHIMGCPEWEDADFTGDLKDDFNPAWHRVELGGFRRPRWFVQGRLKTCLRYLKARRRGNAAKSAFWWSYLAFERRITHLMCANPVAAELPLRTIIENGCAIGGWARVSSAILLTALIFVLRSLVFVWNLLRTVRNRCVEFVWNLLRRTVRNRCVESVYAASRRSDRPFWIRLGRRLPGAQTVHRLMTHCRMHSGAMRRRKRILRRTRSVFSRWRELRGGPRRLKKVRIHVRRRLRKRRRRRRTETLSWTLDRRGQRLQRAFDEAFPDRRDRLTAADFAPYEYSLPLWRPVFDLYDLIVGYSTDPILPMIAGKPYFALEHGTLRDIPFEDSTQGRLTALAYHLADHVFVTNSDCLDNAHRLAGDRVTFINHPYDDRPSPPDSKVHELAKELEAELDAEYLFFFPTRHDWVAGTGFADKANDVFLRAFARLRDAGLRVGMVCCAWGKNVEDSRQLLQDLGVSSHVRWEKPMALVGFKRMARACGLVVDQFKLGSFGGVLFKSLAAGVPCLTYLDNQAVARRFGAPVPCLNARTEDEIVRELTAALADPRTLADLGRQSRNWIDAHHSSRETIARQMWAFMDFLDRQDRTHSTNHCSRRRAA